jgi:hypothetical protein
MATSSITCRYCGHEFLASRADARYCSASHRARASQQAASDRRDAARDLLMRQTRAIIDGADPAALAEIAAEAERLLPSGV